MVNFGEPVSHFNVILDAKRLRCLVTGANNFVETIKKQPTNRLPGGVKLDANAFRTAFELAGAKLEHLGGQEEMWAVSPAPWGGRGNASILWRSSRFCPGSSSTFRHDSLVRDLWSRQLPDYLLHVIYNAHIGYFLLLDLSSGETAVYFSGLSTGPGARTLQSDLCLHPIPSAALGKARASTCFTTCAQE